MKKIVLSLAVLATVALVSCNKAANGNDSDSCDSCKKEAPATVDSNAQKALDVVADAVNGTAEQQPVAPEADTNAPA